MINNEKMTFTRLALALSGDYESFYYLNTEDDSYVEYGTSDEDDELHVLSEGEDFFADTVQNCKKIVFIEDQERFLSRFNKEKLYDDYNNGRSFTLDYRLVIGDEILHYNLKTIKGRGKDDKYIIIGVRNINDEVNRTRKESEKNVTYGHIAQALASRYEVIYYVDVETNEYMEFSSSEAYAKLKVGIHGYDFFAETQQNMKRDIYPEDYPMMRDAMQKDNFLREVSKNGLLSITYRLMLGGNAEYVNLRAVRPLDDEKHVIIGVSNINASVQKENEYKEAISGAMVLAQKDELTGVKNKNAYSIIEKEIDRQIGSGEVAAFGIVVCDLNDLKRVNDTLGHQAGDEYIKLACSIICRIFTHSPVYRVGGDEFAVLLRGSDYEARELLLEKLKAEVENNKKTGRVVIACGLSVFDDQCDTAMADVFERADSQMYRNKKALKNA